MIAFARFSARRRARRSCASATSRRCRGRATASGCRAAGRWREVLNTDAAVYGGSGVGNAGAVDGRASALARPAVVGRAAAAAARRDLARARWPVDSARLATEGTRPQVWPGRPFPLGATWDGEGTNFSLFSEHAERVELCLFDADGPRAAPRADAAHGLQLARLPAGRRARASATASRPRPLRARARAPLQPRQAAARPLREGDRRRRALGRGEHAALPARRGGRRRCADDADDARRDAALRRHRPGLRLGGRPAARDALARDGHLRAARQGLHEAAPGGARGPARHLRRPRLRRGDRPPASRSASPPSSCCRCTTSSTRASSHERGLTNYWGYSSIGFLAPHAGYAATGVAGEQIKEFKGMVKALHRAGIEVILDVVYNHTAEGNHLGPMLSFKGIDNASLLPPDARRPAPLHGLHGHRQQPQPGAPERAAADHGLAALLGHRVPRRRLPLRPRLGARARALRRRPALGVLRRDPPGPGALAGQADRRALGPRPGRLPGRQLPGALDGVERPLPRHDARRLARPGATSRRSPRASPARATSTSRDGRRPVGLDQLRHRARRLHARRPRLLQREAQRGQRRGQPRRHRRQPLVELRRRGPDRRSRRSRRCASASSATSWPRCCSRRACRCCSPATSSAAPRAATTTPGARTTRSPGSTGSSTSASDGAARVHAAAARAAPRASDLPPHAVPRRRGLGRRACRTPGGSGPTAGA